LQAHTQLDLGFAMVDKRRSSGQLMGGLMVAGEVQGRWVVLLDDLVSTGRTAAMAAAALRQSGAIGVILVVTHAVLSPQARDHLASPDIDQILWTDSIAPSRLPPDCPWAQKVTVVSAGALLSKAIEGEFAANSMARSDSSAQRK
jgi:ribose-phosphate pyrophosphokinase